MKRLVSVLKGLLVVVVVGVCGLAVYVARTWNRTYDVPLPALAASADPAVIKRGEYIVFGPAHCVECHVASTDEARAALEGGKRPPLSGGMKFALGPLGVVYSKNLTPDRETGIGRYTDGQIARMMRWAVRPDGRASIPPMMPFGDMSDEDIVAVMSYLRSQPPVRREVPSNEWTLMGKVLKSFLPTALPRKSIRPAPAAPAAPSRERGEYLARYVGNCVGCHTPRNTVTFLPVGPEFAGGLEMEPAVVASADARVFFRTPNLTPQKGSALLKFPDRETFIARFKRGGRQHEGSPMPWEAYANMSEADLGALYEYLHGLAPQPGPTGEPTFRKSS